MPNNFSSECKSGNVMLEEVAQRECFCGVCSFCLDKDDELGIWRDEE